MEIDITKCAICDGSPVFDEEYDWFYVSKTKVYIHKVCGRKLIGKFLDEKFKASQPTLDTDAQSNGESEIKELPEQIKIPDCPQCNRKMIYIDQEEYQFACKCDYCDIIDWFCMYCSMEKSICICGGSKEVTELLGTEKCECCEKIKPFAQIEHKRVKQTSCAISHAVTTFDYLLDICKQCIDEGWELDSVHA